MAAFPRSELRLVEGSSESKQDNITSAIMTLKEHTPIALIHTGWFLTGLLMVFITVI